MYGLTKKRYEELWLGHYSMGVPECESMGVPECNLSKTELKAIQLALAEVATRAAQIKAGWSKKVAADRHVGPDIRIPWTIPEYVTAYVTAYPPLEDSDSSRNQKRTRVYKALLPK